MISADIPASSEAPRPFNIEFKFLDRYMDNNALEDDWRELDGQTRATILVVVFIGLVLAFALLCG